MTAFTKGVTLTIKRLPKWQKRYPLWTPSGPFWALLGHFWQMLTFSTLFWCSSKASLLDPFWPPTVENIKRQLSQKCRKSEDSELKRGQKWCFWGPNQSIGFQAFYRLKWSSRKHKKDSIIIGKKRRHVSIVKIQQKLCFRGQKWGFGGQIYRLQGFLSTQMK